MSEVQKDGRRRDIGLGSASKVPLKLARERAAEVRQQIELGIDPVAERPRRLAFRLFRSRKKGSCREQAPSWKNAKHARNGSTRSKPMRFLSFGNRSVADIDAAAVRDCLAAIWLEKPETARRLRQRIRDGDRLGSRQGIPGERPCHAGDRQGAPQAARQGEASCRAPPR